MCRQIRPKALGHLGATTPAACEASLSASVRIWRGVLWPLTGMGAEASNRRLDGEALFAAAERDVEAWWCRQRDVVAGGLRPRSELVTFVGRPRGDRRPGGPSPEGSRAEGSGAAGGGPKRRP